MRRIILIIMISVFIISCSSIERPSASQDASQGMHDEDAVQADTNSQAPANAADVTDDAGDGSSVQADSDTLQVSDSAIDPADTTQASDEGLDVDSINDDAGLLDDSDVDIDMSSFDDW